MIEYSRKYLTLKFSIANCLISKTTIVISTLEMGTVNINEKTIMFGFNIGGKHEFLLYTLIFISKWSIWKARNNVKYNKIHINQTLHYNIWKRAQDKFKSTYGHLSAGIFSLPVFSITHFSNALPVER